MALRRLASDLKKVTSDPPAGVSAGAEDGDVFKWNAMIGGPGDTPFQGGTFRLRMEFPQKYPQAPPKVWFHSKMFHPNVYPDGRICLDILEDPKMWKPEYEGGSVLQAIQAMLGEPNPDSPANGEANILFLNDQAEYEKRVAEIVYRSTMDDSDESGNLNVIEAQQEINERLEELDLSDFAGDAEAIKNFLRS